MDFQKVLEITFVKNLKSHAYILEDGEIYIQLELGKMYSKKSFLESIGMGPKSSQPLMYDKKFVEERLKIFDSLYEYYHRKYVNAQGEIKPEEKIGKLRFIPTPIVDKPLYFYYKKPIPEDSPIPTEEPKNIEIKISSYQIEMLEILSQNGILTKEQLIEFISIKKEELKPSEYYKKFIAIYSEHGSISYSKQSTFEEAKIFLDYNETNGNIFPIAIVDLPKNKIEWGSFNLTSEEVQKRVEHTLNMIKNENSPSS